LLVWVGGGLITCSSYYQIIYIYIYTSKHAIVYTKLKAHNENFDKKKEE